MTISKREANEMDEYFNRPATLAGETRTEGVGFGEEAWLELVAKTNESLTLEQRQNITAVLEAVDTALNKDRDGVKAIAARLLEQQRKLATAEAALTQAQQERDALLQEKKRDMEKVHLEWSDRGGDWHPTEFWEAVWSCALDHHYDRTSDGVPYGVPDIYRVEFAPVVARHLSAVNPNWKDETVYQMTKERQDIFETELKDVNARVYEQVKQEGV